VTNPAKSMKGIIVMVNTPPAKIRSVKFIEISIATMLMKLILKAIFKASEKGKLFIKIKVSNKILVTSPLNMAISITR
jgi:hypothetical protein|tara:strand:- start:407 stop:640 length:234 start_codon:yes stop_codon:yes gene_type:complete